MYEVMAESVDISCFGHIAAAALAGLSALFGAGGSFGLLPCTIVVAKCVGVSVDVAIATGCAGVSGVTLFRACGLGDNCVVVVAGCGYLFVSRVITAIASVICCPAICCAGCCFAIMMYEVMAESVDISCFGHIAAAALAGLSALFGAGGSFGLLPCTIIVAECVGVAVRVGVATVVTYVGRISFS